MALLYMNLFITPVLVDSPEDSGIIERTYGGTKYDRGVHISAAGDCGYLITGYSNDTAVGDEDVYLIRIDVLGKAI